MRTIIAVTVLSLLSPVLPTLAQVPEALLPPATNNVPMPEALVPPSTNLLVHSLAATNADPAWEELLTASRPPHPPAEWQAKEPSEKESEAFFLPYVLALVDKAKDFYTRFPKDSHAADARKQEFEMTGVAVRMGATNQQSRLDTEEKVILADPALSEDDRFSIRQGDIEQAAAAKEAEKQAAGAKDEESESAAAAEFEKGVRVLQKEFPKRPEVLAMLMGLASDSEGDKARTLLSEVTNSPAATDEIKEAAAAELKKLDGLGKPVELQFTAVDGRAVDVSKLKGKVVLVDFWATRDEASVEELPHVKVAYDQLHAKGFEIIGVSLDREKGSLTQFVAEHKMEWPQYFDGQEENKLASRLGIENPPALWLIDKKGNLRDINASLGLSGKIEKLLAE
jgi:peroxiredoxin